MFDKLKQLNNLRQQASDLKKKLDQELIEFEANGIKIILNGNLEIKSINIDKEIPPEKLEILLKDTLNETIKKAQSQIANKLSASLNLPF